MGDVRETQTRRLAAKEGAQGAPLRRVSLKKRLAGIFILLIVATIFLCWFANVFLLEKFYLSRKQSILIEVYHSIAASYDEEQLGSEAFAVEMRRLCSENNISFIVTDSSSRTLYTSINDEERFNHFLRDTIFSRNAETTKVLTEEDGYTVSIMRDPATQTEYLAMWGNLDEDNFFMIRTAVESIRESVRLANGFLLYVGLIAILLAGIVTWFVASKITNPILELAEISQEMTELNFEKKYAPRGHRGSEDEIALLGRNINALSARLEATISDLKTANLELRRDMEAREKADERRSEFIANVSHELKTPIALIQGYAEGLKEGIIEDAESRNDYCDVIMDETKKMNHLVKRLISLNQVESGQDAMMMERFDLNDLIESCIESFALLTESAGIEVAYEARSGLYVWADEYQIEEVLRNYFSNAVNHCSGRKRIEVRAQRLEGEMDGHLRVSVYNTGDPIPQESLSKLWEKFYKVDKARTREYGGSGLGLSIVKAIMESLGQDYGVANDGDGVVFWFVLETK